MNFLGPIFMIGRAFNTAANLYLAAQIGWTMYKNWREISKEKLEAQELKDRFIKEYVTEHGALPSDELVSLALRSYNAVENPVRERIKRAVGWTKK